MGGAVGKKEIRKGRKMGGMVMEVRRGIETVKEDRMEVNGMMTKVIRLEGEEWRIVRVYVNGDLQEKWEILRQSAKDGSREVRTIVEGDFNVRTGTLGGWWEGGGRRGEEIKGW